MLTIKNLFKIRNKTLDKKNFFIFDVYEYPEQYKFEITNRKWVSKVMLKRKQVFGGFYVMECHHTKKSVTMDLAQIQNIDILLDKIRFVGIK